MNLQQNPTITIERPGARHGSERRLQGAQLALARIAWLLIAGLSIGLFVAALPPYFAYLHGINTASPYGPQLAPSDVQELLRLGLSLDFYAWLTISVTVIILLISVLVGVVLFWRASSDPLALLASLTLVLFPIALNNQLVGTLPPAWTVPTEGVAFFGDISIGLFFSLFPSGRFVPRWTRWLMIAWGAFWANSSFFPTSPLNNSLLTTIPFVGLLISLIAVQIYGYRHVSTPVQRQQTKWVVFGIALGFGSFVIGTIVLYLLLPRFVPMSPLAHAIGQIPLSLVVLLFPLSIGFAISHARLWEIDRLISRTLVYGTVTITLGLIYGGLVIGFQALLRGIISQTNDVAIVVSTLVIAALFRPLRRRIQQIIDRRFYRRTYDAARTLKAFSTTLRNEVDLVPLSEHLVAVVQETMQPTHVSLWLRKDEQLSTPPTDA